MWRTVALGVWLVVVGCVGPSTPSSSPNDAALAADAAPPSSLRYRGAYVDGVESAHSITFENPPKAPGDAIILFVASETGTPSAFTTSAPGWTFTPLVTTDSAAVFGVVAPDISSPTITVTSSAGGTTVVVADEFSGNDPTGGLTTFDASSAAKGTGACATAVVTGHDDDAVWALCHVASSSELGLGAGYEPGDHLGTWGRAEYKLTADPANTTEQVPMPLVNGAGPYEIAAVTIKPR